jgi:hypothetical protein
VSSDQQRFSEELNLKNAVNLFRTNVRFQV